MSDADAVLKSDFWNRGYAVVEGLLDQAKLDFASNAIGATAAKGTMRKRDDDCVRRAYDEYSPVFGEILLRHCRPMIEAAIGRELLESYAYWRIYHKGAELMPHMDRAACEISVTLTIASDPEGDIWPILVEDLEGNEVPIRIAPGSGLVYQGSRVRHWRKPLQATAQKQLLLHYVLKDGLFADHAFDKRDADPMKRRSASITG